eukprot:1141699-Pelagomonas_calceolata.AAC.3
MYSEIVRQGTHTMGVERDCWQTGVNDQCELCELQDKKHALFLCSILNSWSSAMQSTLSQQALHIKKAGAAGHISNKNLEQGSFYQPCLALLKHGGKTVERWPTHKKKE